MTSILERELSSHFLHHAYIAGLDEELSADIKDILGRNKNSGATINEYEYDLLGIDDARSLRANFSLVRGVQEFVIIKTHGITIEAQNALLKTLEETADLLHIFLLVAKPDELIDTLRSRCYELGYEGSGRHKEIYEEAKKFMAENISERISRVTDLASAKTDDERRAAKIRAELFITELEAQVYSNYNDVIMRAKAGSAITNVRKALVVRGLPLRLALEDLCLSVP